MRLKLDENLPESLLDSLVALGHDVDNVRLQSLAGRPDPEIWQAAQASKRFLVTQDLDFSDVRTFRPGTHHGLLLLRIHAPGRLALSKRVLEIFQAADVEIWSRCFVLATDHKVRVHGPKP